MLTECTQLHSLLVNAHLPDSQLIYNDVRRRYRMMLGPLNNDGGISGAPWIKFMCSYMFLKGYPFVLLCQRKHVFNNLEILFTSTSPLNGILLP